MDYFAAANKNDRKSSEEDRMEIPYGWTYLKFDENKKILKFDNFSDDYEFNHETEGEYYIRRDLYYKDINRLIRYRIEDQMVNHDPIYFDDIIEELGDFDEDPYANDSLEYEDGGSDSDENSI